MHKINFDDILRGGRPNVPKLIAALQRMEEEIQRLQRLYAVPPVRLLSAKDGNSLALDIAALKPLLDRPITYVSRVCPVFGSGSNAGVVIGIENEWTQEMVLSGEVLGKGCFTNPTGCCPQGSGSGSGNDCCPTTALPAQLCLKFVADATPSGIYGCWNNVTCLLTYDPVNDWWHGSVTYTGSCAQEYTWEFWLYCAPASSVFPYPHWQLLKRMHNPLTGASSDTTNGFVVINCSPFYLKSDSGQTTMLADTAAYHWEISEDLTACGGGTVTVPCCPGAAIPQTLDFTLTGTGGSGAHATDCFPGTTLPDELTLTLDCGTSGSHTYTLTYDAPNDGWLYTGLVEGSSSSLFLACTGTPTPTWKLTGILNGVNSFVSEATFSQGDPLLISGTVSIGDYTAGSSVCLGDWSVVASGAGGDCECIDSGGQIAWNSVGNFWFCTVFVCGNDLEFFLSCDPGTNTFEVHFVWHEGAGSSATVTGTLVDCDPLTITGTVTQADWTGPQPPPCPGDFTFSLLG